MCVVSRKVATASLLLALLCFVSGSFVLKIFFSPHGPDKLIGAVFGGRYLDEVGVTRQRKINECSIACMRMFLQAHGVELTYADLLQRTRLIRDGASMAEMLRVIHSLNVPARYTRICSADLGSIPLPAIAFIRGNHFVVITEVQPHWITVEDPAIGRVRYLRPLFQLSWEGDVLLPSPSSTLTMNQKGEHYDHVSLAAASHP